MFLNYSIKLKLNGGPIWPPRTKSCFWFCYRLCCSVAAAEPGIPVRAGPRVQGAGAHDGQQLDRRCESMARRRLRQRRCGRQSSATEAARMSSNVFVKAQPCGQGRWLRAGVRVRISETVTEGTTQPRSHAHSSMLRTHVPALKAGGGFKLSEKKLPREPPPALISSGVSHCASSLLHG